MSSSPTSNNNTSSPGNRELSRALADMRAEIREVYNRIDKSNTYQLPGNYTLGSVLFGKVGGVIGQDNAQLFWDDTNNRLGVGTLAPSLQLESKMKDDFPAINIAELSGSNRRATIGFGVNGTTANTGWIMGQGLNSNTVKDFYLVDATAGAIRLYIDTTGEVGIGTTVPDATVHAKRTDGGYQFKAETSTRVYGWGASVSTFFLDDVTAARRDITVLSSGNVGIGGSAFAPTRVLSLDLTGNVYMSFNSAGVEKSVFGWETTGSGRTVLVDSVAAAYQMIWQHSTGFVGIGMAPTLQLELSLNSAGKPTSNVWNVTSDQRTKKAISPFTSALAELKALPQVKTYKYNGKYGTPEDEEGVGFVAQDLQTIIPEWVKHRTMEVKVRDKKPPQRGDPEEELEQVEVLSNDTGAHIYIIHNALLELAAIVEGLQATRIGKEIK